MNLKKNTKKIYKKTKVFFLDFLYFNTLIDSTYITFSGNCNYTIQKCNGKTDEDDCQKPEDCYYGKTCRKNQDLVNKCLPPLKEGDPCEVDTDCEIDCGCMKGNCTKYFSLDDWEQTGGLDYYSDFNFCRIEQKLIFY